MSSQTFESLAERLSNWGRWGDDDQLGTVNFITPAKVAAAAELVLSGEIVPLGIEFGSSGPQVAHPRRFNPLHFMSALHDSPWTGGATSADDVIMAPLQAATQWDALAHVGFHGRLYNGRPTDAVSVSGASVNAIAAVSGRIATRGVLADVAGHLRLEALEPGFAVTDELLTECLAAQGVEVGEGDILLVRTGFLESSRRRGWAGFSGSAPGLGVSALPWIHERRLAGIAVDTSAAEVRPFDLPGFDMPFHVLGLVYMGLLLGEIFDLERLAERCRFDGRWEFMLVAPPLAVTGGVGSPINPYAIR